MKEKKFIIINSCFGGPGRTHIQLTQYFYITFPYMGYKNTFINNLIINVGGLVVEFLVV